ncbi:MAG: tetratricopeptide repeat protein [Myxococcota bacterium]
MAQTSQDGPAIARAYTNLGNLAAMQGDLAAARSRYERALAIDKRWGQVRAVAGGLVNLASIAATEGRPEAALKSYGEALGVCVCCARRARRPISWPRTAEAAWGAFERRRAPLHRGARPRRRAKAGHHLGEARLAGAEAALLHARGQVEAALQGYRQAVPRLEAVGGASDLAVLWLVVADATLAAGDPSGARAAVEAAATRIDDSDAREAIDVRVARARVRLATEPDLDARAVAAAQAQADAGRTSDAMASRLAVVDLGLDPVADRALAEQLVPEAEALGLAPLRIDARSALLGLAGGDPREGEELCARPTAWASALALRVRRRLAVALDLVGRHDEATRVRAEAAAKSARAWGAKAELARLEARR